jgi:hypothetical protein
MRLDSAILELALRTVGENLEAQGHEYEVVACGGGALLLLGLSRRATQDLDVLAVVKNGAYISSEPLPLALVEIAADVGRALGLVDKWLNPGPASLLDLGLPDGFVERVETRRFGGLTIHLASRLDQICLKLMAEAYIGPESKHLIDLLQLRPNRDELLFAARWARTQDPSEGFSFLLSKALAELGFEVGSASI